MARGCTSGQALSGGATLATVKIRIHRARDLERQLFDALHALFLRALDLDPENTRARECIKALERLRAALTTVQEKVAS